MGPPHGQGAPQPEHPADPLGEMGGCPLGQADKQPGKGHIHQAGKQEQSGDKFGAEQREHVTAERLGWSLRFHGTASLEEGTAVRPKGLQLQSDAGPDLGVLMEAFLFALPCCLPIPRTSLQEAGNLPVGAQNQGGCTFTELLSPEGHG